MTRECIQDRHDYTKYCLPDHSNREGRIFFGPGACLDSIVSLSGIRQPSLCQQRRLPAT